MKSKIFFAILLIGLAGAGVGYYFFQKEVASLDKVEPDFRLTADELYDAFEKDEAAANALYIDKVIEVSGKVDRFTVQESGVNVVLTAENAIAGGVNCAFTEAPARLEPGTSVKIKGKCQGFLLDVVLNNCSIVP